MIHFKHQQRRKFFVVFDFISVCLAVSLAVYIRRYIPLPVFEGLLPIASTGDFSSLIGSSLCLALLFVMSQYVLGIYDVWHTTSAMVWAKRLIPTNILMVAVAFSYLYLIQDFSFPRSLLAVLLMTSWFLTIGWRVFYFVVAGREVSEIVLVGTADQVAKIGKELEHEPFCFHIKIKAAFVLDNPKINISGYPILQIGQFDSFSKEHPYTSVILAPSDYQQQIFNQVLNAARRGVAIYAIPTIYDILLGRLNHLRINDLPLLELRLNPPSGVQQAFKRVFDFAMSVILLILLSPLMTFAAILIKLTSTGKVLYTQERVGKDGKKFQIYKFRSMVSDAEKLTGAVLASKYDPRITRFGRIMRITRLDELPQLFNILNGEMSFVGPRPERPVFVNKFEKEIPGYKERIRIKPGVTGLAQVSGNYGSSADIKLKYDLAYVANQKFTLDLQILFRTLKTVVSRAGQ